MDTADTYVTVLMPVYNQRAFVSPLTACFGTATVNSTLPCQAPGR